MLDQLGRARAAAGVAGAQAKRDALAILERSDKHAVRPLAVVGEVRALAGHPVEFFEVAIEVEHHQWLLLALPGPLPALAVGPHGILDRVDALGQGLELVVGDEASQEVARRGRIGSPHGVEHLEHRGVVLEHRQILETGAAGVQHQRLRDDVIRLMVGQVPLEHLDVVVEDGRHVEAAHQGQWKRQPAQRGHVRSLVLFDVQLGVADHCPPALGPG